jgi:hypothetical protein
MYSGHEFQIIPLLALGSAAIFAIARGSWLYRASLTWPTADGVITRIDVEHRRDGACLAGITHLATISTTQPRTVGTEVGTRISPVKKRLASFQNENCR